MQILRIATLVLVLAGAGGHARADDPPGAEALAAAQELLAVLSPD